MTTDERVRVVGQRADALLIYLKAPEEAAARWLGIRERAVKCGNVGLVRIADRVLEVIVDTDLLRAAVDSCEPCPDCGGEM